MSERGTAYRYEDNEFEPPLSERLSRPASSLTDQITEPLDSYRPRESYSLLLSGDSIRDYLHAIGQVPLLSAEEEVELAKRIEAGVVAEKALAFTELKNPKDVTEVFERAKAATHVYVSDLLASQKKSFQELRRIHWRKQNIEPPDAETIQALLDQDDKVEKQLTLEYRSTQSERYMKLLIGLAAGNMALRGTEGQLLLPAKQTELKLLARDGRRARNHMIEANLRLVANIAKRYVGQGLSYLDLINEGNAGLIHAVEMFDYSKGWKFSTYATWWIRQHITRGIANDSRPIRLPLHMHERVKKQTRAERAIIERGQTLTDELLSKETHFSIKQIEENRSFAQVVFSLDQPVNAGDARRPEDETLIGDLLLQASHESSAESTYEQQQMASDLAELVHNLFGSGTVEERVIRLHFGFVDGGPRNLSEIANELNISPYKVRNLIDKILEQLQKHTPESFREYLSD